MPKTTTQTDAMLRVPEVMTRTGFSRTSIWRKTRNGTFPPPIRLGENSIGWRESVVAEWVSTRPPVNYAPEQKAEVT